MDTDNKLEALNRLLGDSAEMSGWCKEADDTDALLRHLGLDPATCRTEAGWLNLPHIKTLLAEQEQAEPTGKNWSDNHVAVNKGALQMVRNAQRTDAEAGKQSRAKMLEMLEELDKATFVIAKQAEQESVGNLHKN